MIDESQDVQVSLPEPVELEAPPVLTADQIRAAPDHREELVPVPEWGGAVRVRSLSMDEAMALGARAEANGQTDPSLLSKLTLIAACPDLDESAVEWIGEKGPAPLKRLFEAVKRLQGISAEEVADAAHTFRAGPPAPVRAPAGGTAQHDGA
jgi:hypothetical protein